MSQDKSVKKYAPLVGVAGIGSMLGSGIIIGLSATITVWQAGLGLTEGQVGILSGALTFAIVAGLLLAGTISILSFMYAGICLQIHLANSKLIFWLRQTLHSQSQREQGLHLMY